MDEVSYQVISKDASAEYTFDFDALADATEHFDKSVATGKWLSVEILKTTHEIVNTWEKE